MRDVNDKIIKTNKYILDYFYINEIIIVEKIATVCVSIKIHLIDNLKVNMLVKIDILKLQKIILNFEHNIFNINSC